MSMPVQVPLQEQMGIKAEPTMPVQEPHGIIEPTMLVQDPPGINRT